MIEDYEKPDLQLESYRDGSSTSGMSEPIVHFGILQNELIKNTDKYYKIHFIQTHGAFKIENVFKIANFLKEPDPVIRSEAVRALRKFVAHAPTKKIKRASLNAMLPLEQDEDTLIRLMVIDLIKKHRTLDSQSFQNII